MIISTDKLLVKNKLWCAQVIQEATYEMYFFRLHVHCIFCSLIEEDFDPIIIIRIYGILHILSLNTLSNYDGTTGKYTQIKYKMWSTTLSYIYKCKTAKKELQELSLCIKKDIYMFI